LRLDKTQASFVEHTKELQHFSFTGGGKENGLLSYVAETCPNLVSLICTSHSKADNAMTLQRLSRLQKLRVKPQVICNTLSKLTELGLRFESLTELDLRTQIVYCDMKVNSTSQS